MEFYLALKTQSFLLLNSLLFNIELQQFMVYHSSNSSSPLDLFPSCPSGFTPPSSSSIISGSKPSEGCSSTSS